MNITPQLKNSCLIVESVCMLSSSKNSPWLNASTSCLTPHVASLSSGFQGNAGSSCSACGAPAPGEGDTGPMGAFGGPMGPGPMGRMSGRLPMGVGKLGMVESEPNKSGLDF